MSDIDGIEHTAGVGKGGTFILVEGEKREVVADFSLSGQVPCCRDLEPPKVEPPKTGNIIGRVVDEENRPYVKSSVFLSQNRNPGFLIETSTWKNGEFWFFGVPVGAYQVIVPVTENYDLAKRETKNIPQLTAGQTIPVDEFIIPRKKNSPSGRITGQVSYKKIPLPDAVVSLQHDNQKVERETANEQGIFSYDSLTPGRYLLFASYGGQGSDIKPIVLAEGESKENIELIIVFELPDLEDEAQKALLKIYTTRHGVYLNHVDSVSEQVQKSDAWQKSNDFIRNEIPINTKIDELIPHYEEISSQLIEQIQGAGISEDDKKDYRLLLASLSSAMLDSITRSNLNQFDRHLLPALEIIKQRLTKAQVNPADFNEQWNGEQLATLFRPEIVKTILKFLN
ncbi:MAG: carboxypeptidase regulatory-like domain-containing protein [Candidatus Electrothrix sp. ATG1]|nr:carboxypeptidase regulatory-like domain-containing protein [Candidatus Electrothrix sp. ATG1]